MENLKKVGRNNPVTPDPVSIYCIVVDYVFCDGHTEVSSPKYVGQSEDDALKAISQMLGICRTCLPESIREVRYSIQGYRRRTFESGGSADELVSNVVSHILRHNDESVGTEC